MVTSKSLNDRGTKFWSSNMSWIHAYSREDFSFYLLCSARYEFICESVGRMEWRLDDFYSEGLLIAFENTLAARSEEIGAKLDELTRKPDLSPTLTQMLDASESMVRSYLSSVIENANSQLLRLRLGKQLLLAENERRVAKGARIRVRILTKDCFGLHLKTKC